MKTVLCVPGHDERKVAKCREYGADLILFDLEDSVPENMKDRAREIVAANITPEDAVRVNAHRAEQDLEAIGAWHPLSLAAVRKVHSVWLPKGSALTPHYFLRSPVVHIIETPHAVFNLSTLQQPDLLGVAFGAADFAAYMNVPASSPQVAYARQQVALAAAALRVDAYDSPCTSLNRYEIQASTNRAMALGYGWMGVIHPMQISVIKEFSGAIDRNELTRYRQLVDQYDEQVEACMLQMPKRELIAPPMIRAARRRLEDAKK